VSQEKNFIRKRRVPRRVFFRKVGLLARGSYYITEAMEVGEGGMQLMSPVPLEEGQQVVISFSIPGMDYVVTRSVVRYVKNSLSDGDVSYGVQFETIDFDSRRKIRSYVAQKSIEELNAYEEE